MPEKVNKAMPTKEKIRAFLKKTAAPEFTTDIPAGLTKSLSDVMNGSCSDKDYIRSNIFHAANQILDGKAIQGELRDFIGNALFEIGFNKVDANQAFKLKKCSRKKGQKTDEVRIALMVMWKVHVQNMTVVDACFDIGDYASLSESRTQHIYYKHKNDLEREAYESSS